MQQIGKRLRKYRLKHGISVSQMARDLDIGRQYLYRIENGDNHPSIGVTERIAKRIGVRLTYQPVNGKRKRAS